MMSVNMNQALVILPPPPPRFTLDEWKLTNRHRFRTAEDQQRLADSTLTESQRVRDATSDLTHLNKEQVDRKLQERIQYIEFCKNSLDKQKSECCKEEEVMKTYKERLINTIQSLREQALTIIKKCVVLREGRLGIDLVHDSVEKELVKEVETIESILSLLQRTLEQTNEQLRLIRSTKYFIDRDRADKVEAMKIDNECLSLKETSLNLSYYVGTGRLDAGNITEEEWDNYSRGNIQRAVKEVNSSRPLRSYVDILLKQCIEDLWEQYYKTNEAFLLRIEEIREAKSKLENEHREVLGKINDMMRNITDLKKAILEKEGFLALVHTRLGKRLRRPNIELCRDEVELGLVSEMQDLKDNIAWLRQTLNESEASLRYLLKIQIQLEEDINIKTNTLKIDEVDCMTMRRSIDYRIY